MTDQQQPLLPASPWYTSEVQVRAVIAIVAQLISIALRVIGRYTELSVTTEMVDAVVADISQAVAVIFGGLAIVKRQTSVVSPLTLTAKAAEQATISNPSMLQEDPTKVPGPQQTATMSSTKEPIQ